MHEVVVVRDATALPLRRHKGIGLVRIDGAAAPRRGLGYNLSVDVRELINGLEGKEDGLACADVDLKPARAEHVAAAVNALACAATAAKGLASSLSGRVISDRIARSSNALCSGKQSCKCRARAPHSGTTQGGM